MTIREASENIGKLVIHKELGMLFWIDSITERTIRAQQVKVRSIDGMNSYFYPEDLMLMQSDVQKWHDVYQSTPVALTNTSPPPSIDSKFKPGDVVQLKSGGPLMTVYDIESNGQYIGCVWFTKSPMVKPVSFLANVLTLINPLADSPDIVQAGSVVRLRSGGPDFTVACITDNEVAEGCRFDGDELNCQVRVPVFLLTTLEPISSPSDQPISTFGLGDLTHAKLLEIAERKAQWDTSDIPRIYSELLAQLYKVNADLAITKQ